MSGEGVLFSERTVTGAHSVSVDDGRGRVAEETVSDLLSESVVGVAVGSDLTETILGERTVLNCSLESRIGVTVEIVECWSGGVECHKTTVVDGSSVRNISWLLEKNGVSGREVEGGIFTDHVERVASFRVHVDSSERTTWVLRNSRQYKVFLIRSQVTLSLVNHFGSVLVIIIRNCIV